jgi:branched-chain amino acid transport system substrate-binding protein
MTLTRSTLAVALLLMAQCPNVAGAQAGVDSNAIVFGQAAALEGPVASLGNDVRAGLLAAFNEANSHGGVHGRRLKLVSNNDSYEPEQSVEATEKLIDTDQVFALVGAVGTGPSMAAEPIAQRSGVPFIAPVTGAEFLRDPKRSNVVNIRASYFDETEFMIDHLVKDRGITKIGLLYEDDSFGYNGRAGVTQALERRGLKLTAEGSFERNTQAVKSALFMIRKANPEAVIMFAPTSACIQFIKLAHSLNFSPLFFASSMNNIVHFASALGSTATGIFTTQVVPASDTSPGPAEMKYRAALAAADRNAPPDAMSFEGYLVGRLIISALNDAGDAPTRKSFLAAIYGHAFDIDGVVFDFRDPGNKAAPLISLGVIGPDGKTRLIGGLNAAIQ